MDVVTYLNATLPRRKDAEIVDADVVANGDVAGVIEGRLAGDEHVAAEAGEAECEKVLRGIEGHQALPLITSMIRSCSASRSAG